MDLSNGRSGRVKGQASQPRPIVFTLPISGEEILLLTDLSGEDMGIIYHPRKMAVATPWKATCPHCIRGQNTDLDISVKRAVRVLCSRKIVEDVEEYTVPTNGCPCTIWCKRSDTGLIVKVLQPNKEPVDAIWQGNKFLAQGKSLVLESKIVGRALKVISSVKNVSKREAKVCLMPLLEKQRKEGINTHRRFACLKIDWATLLAS